MRKGGILGRRRESGFIAMERLEIAVGVKVAGSLEA